MILEISLTKNYSTKCMERKNSEHIHRKTNRRRLVFYPTIQLVIVNLYIKYELSVLYSCGDIFDKNMERKKKEQIQGRTTRIRLIRERKVNIYTEKQTGEGWFSIPRYNLSLLICIQNMNFLCYTVVEISLPKHMERKKKEQKIKRKTNRRRLILYPTIQLVIVNLYTKYEVSILNHFGDIFDEKV